MLFRTISSVLSLSWILFAKKCSATAAKNPTTATTTSLLRLPNGRSMTVCDNIVVRDIPGGTQAVYQKGKEYLESMRNNTRKPFAKFQQKWRAGDSFCTHPPTFFFAAHSCSFPYVPQSFCCPQPRFVLSLSSYTTLTTPFTSLSHTLTIVEKLIVS